MANRRQLWREAASTLDLELRGSYKIRGSFPGFTVEARRITSQNRSHIRIRSRYSSLGLGIKAGARTGGRGWIENLANRPGVGTFAEQILTATMGSRVEVSDPIFSEMVAARAGRVPAAVEFLNEPRRRAVIDYFSVAPRGRITDTEVRCNHSDTRDVGDLVTWLRACIEVTETLTSTSRPSAARSRQAPPTPEHETTAAPEPIEPAESPMAPPTESPVEPMEEAATTASEDLVEQARKWLERGSG